VRHIDDATKLDIPEVLVGVRHALTAIEPLSFSRLPAP
jgi:hypothetical protein